MSPPPSTAPGEEHPHPAVVVPQNSRANITLSQDAFGSPEGPQRPLSPDAIGRAMCTIHGVQQHLEQLAFYRAPTSAGCVFVCGVGLGGVHRGCCLGGVHATACMHLG